MTSDIVATLRALSEAIARSADLLEQVEELTAESPLTIDETAAALRIDERTVRRYIADGRLDAFKVGPHWRIPRRAVADMVRPELRVVES